MTDFIGNRSGLCVTEGGLDKFWPRDPDVRVDTSSYAFKLFSGGKGGFALPTCAPDALTYEEESILLGIGRDEFLRFVFDGDPLPKNPDVPAVPLPGSGLMLFTTIIAAALLASIFYKRNHHDHHQLEIKPPTHD